MEHAVDVCPFVQILDAPVPQMVGQLLEICRHLDTAVPEQVIDVPKISPGRLQQRLVDRDLRLSQMAEQLAEVPTILYFLKQPIAEQIVGVPIPHGRGVWAVEVSMVFSQNRILQRWWPNNS